MNTQKDSRLHLAELILTKASMNLRSEASRTYLSYSWWLLEPLLLMGIYFIVFEKILNRGGDNFVAFLLIGIIHWLWFSKTISNATMSIVQGRGLIAQIDIPKIFFPLVIVVQDFLKVIIALALLVVLLLLNGIYPNITWIAWIPVLLCQLLLVSSLAIIAAIVVPFMPDLRILITTALQMLMFLSGVFYSHEIIPTNFQTLFFLNPVAKLLYFYREILMYQQWPNWMELGLFFLFIATLFSIVILISSRLDHTLSRLVLG
jgi:lipopolysaccharide transport system permease protein